MLQATSHKPKRLIMGFTLIELMVVMGVIAILGLIVGPGIKKAYTDFKINETYGLLDSLFSSMRSYYLIYNEQHGCDSGPWGSIDERLLPFLEPSVRKFATKYSKTSRGYRWWDFDLYKGLYLFYENKTVYTSFIGYTRKFFSFYKSWQGDRVIDRLYYLEDLLERYRKKGFYIGNDSTEIIISPPEHPDVKWFR